MEVVRDWVGLLVNYGPFALLVFFVFVLERKARATLSDASIPKWISVPAYCANWLAIFALCGTVVYLFFRLNVPAETTILGSFENLRAQETVACKDANLYLRRVYDRGDNFDYDWRLITPKKLPDGTKISFFFDRGRVDAASATRHEITIRPGFYSNPVRIRYRRQQDKLVLACQGKEEELPALEELVREALPSQPWLAWIAQAMVEPSKETIVTRLESSDPIIRQQARLQLSKMGRNALPQVEQALRDPKSSYRLQVAAIAALNKMKGLKGDDISDAVYAVLVEAAGEPDPALAAEAYRFFELYSVAGSAPVGTGKIRVRATNPKDGDFLFLVASSRTPANRVQVRLQELEVYEDSSPGTTQWLFKVLVNQREVLRLPNRRYGDKGPNGRPPQRYPLSLAGTVEAPEGKTLEVRVIGYKPKNLPKPSAKRG